MIRGSRVSDRNAVRQVLAGHREAYATLVERYLRPVHALAFAKTGNRADAEDIAQEAFVRGFENLPSLRDGAKFGAWILTTTRNVAASSLRSELSRRSTVEKFARIAPHSEMPDTEREDLHAQLRSQVMALDDGPREILLLHYFAGNSVREIAGLCEISVDASKKRLQRAREALSAKLLTELEPAFESIRPTNDHATKIMGIVAALPVGLEAAAVEGASAIGGATLIGGIIAMKKAIVVGAIAFIATGGLWISVREDLNDSPGESGLASETEAQDETPGNGDPNFSDASSEQNEDGQTDLTETATESDVIPASEESTIAQESGNGVIRGTVVLAAGGPVRGATIVAQIVDREAGLTVVSKHETIANNAGIFEISGLPLRNHVVQAFTASHHGVAIAGLSESATERTIEIRLEPFGRIAGLVLNSDDAPIADARVFPYRLDGDRNDYSLSYAVAMHVRTGDDGGFVLDHLEPPAWKLLVSAEGYATQDTAYYRVGEGDAVIVLLEGGAISGNVVMAATGQPVPAVDIAITTKYWSYQRKTATDDAGAFRIADLGAGDFWIHLTKDLLVPMGEPPRVTVLEGEETEGVVIELMEGGAISGRVYDASTGEGLSGLRVGTWPESPRDPEVPGRFGPRRFDTTNEEGFYVIEGLMDAQYGVLTERPKGYLSPGVVNELHVATKPGEVVENVDFAFSKGLSIAGIVVDASDRPVQGARVVVRANDDREYATSKADGTFLISPVARSHRVEIGAEKAGFVATPVGPFSMVDSPVEGIRIVLNPEGSISGIVVDAESKPVSGLKLKGRWDRWWPFGIPLFETSQDGRFKLTGLLDGTYEITAYPPGSHNPSNNTIGEVTLSAGEHVTDITLVYDENEGYSISGRVTDGLGNPMAGISVECTGPVRATNETDSDGYYRVTRLSEGIYHVLVDQPRRRNLIRAEVLAGEENVDFVIAKGTIVGQVIAQDSGAPLEAFEIIQRSGTWTDIGLYYNSLKSTHDADGHFELDAFAGDATVFAQAPGYSLGFVQLTVRPEVEGPTEVSLILDPANVVEGLVVDAEGSPLGAAKIYAGEFTLRGRPVGAPLLATTDPEGQFLVDTLSPSADYLSAYHPSHAIGSAPTSGREIRIVMPAGGVLEGTIRSEAGVLDIQNAEVTVRYPGRPELGSTVGTVLADGTYRMEHIVPGECELEAVVAVKRKPSWSTVTLKQSAYVESGIATTVDFEYLTADGSLEGRVHNDGHTIGSVRVYATATDASGEEVRYGSRTDSDGIYRIPNIPSGVATIEVEINEYYLDETEQTGTRGPYSVEIAPGTVTTFDIDINA